jgi:type II secretory pathway pseudopilin PulG
MALLRTRRLSAQAGIAIGPILFIVAILAILATAIAAGSSTFATSSGQEAARTNAAAIIQIGQNLKMGTDRIVALGTPLANVVINAVNTVNSTDLFSPLGGGLVSPSTTLANTPATDTWIYSYADVTNLGTTALDRIAFLKVNSSVCSQINQQVGNSGTLGADLGNAVDAGTNVSAWPSGLAGKMVGCIDNTNSGHQYYFYQIIGVQ